MAFREGSCDAPIPLSPLLENRIKNVLCSYSFEYNCGAYAFLRRVEPVIQDGPQCGLVALQMAGSTLSLPRKKISELMELAKQEGYSNQGEMFSARWLSELAVSLWPSVNCVVAKLPSKKELIELLISDSVLIVPYDCDKNHEPACHNGHNAHWCIVCGYFCPDVKLSDVYWEKRKPQNVESVYVFALHGKSRHFALWNYDCLISSNANLTEIDPGKLSDGNVYIIPEEGLRALKQQCLILS